jgi:hypothetical protein
MGQAQLALLVKEAPAGPEWLHEIKYDGCRLHARIVGGDVALQGIAAFEPFLDGNGSTLFCNVKCSSNFAPLAVDCDADGDHTTGKFGPKIGITIFGEPHFCRAMLDEVSGTEPTIERVVYGSVVFRKPDAFVVEILANVVIGPIPERRPIFNSIFDMSIRYADAAVASFRASQNDVCAARLDSFCHRRKEHR